MGNGRALGNQVYNSQKKTNGDEDDWSDVDAVTAALQDPSDAGLEALSEIVELDRFLSFWATEVLVGHWDGYAGDRNNYHFYREPDGKFVFIPWGVDDTFHLEADPNPFDNISDPPPSVLALSAIPNRLYNIPEWRAKYAERLKDILSNVWNKNDLLASVDRMAAVVAEHALPAEKAKAAADTERVRKFILKRKGEILADITPAPPDWPEPEGNAAPAGSITPEAFEMHFETVWGSNENPNPFEEGEITYLNIEANDPPEAMAVIAGVASVDEQAILPGVDEPVSIAILSLESDGSIAGLTLVLSKDKFTDGATLVLGEDIIGGVVWIIPAGGTVPDWFLPLSGGRLELVGASRKPGATISGRFYGSIGGIPVPGGEGENGGRESGSLEVNFETAWGTNTSADPFSAGGSVSYLAFNGMEEAVESVTAIAGHAGPSERLLLPHVEDLASFAIFGSEEDGSLTGMTLVMPLETMTSGAKLVIGQDTIAGGIWVIPPGGSEPDFFLPFTSGTLMLSRVGTEPGGAIAGTIYASFGDAPQPSQRDQTETHSAIEGSLAVELHFETAWGSKDSLHPTQVGMVTYLVVDGYEEKITEEDLAQIGIIAGDASPEEAGILPGIADPVSITYIVFEDEGFLEGATFVLSKERLTSGAVLRVVEGELGGGTWTIPCGASAPDEFLPLTSGRLEIIEADTTPGAPISVRFSGRFGDAALPATVPEPIAETADIGLVINEVAAKGDPLDWFELYNASGAHLALANFVVADDLTDADKRVAFPADLVIAPGEYLQIELDKDGWPGFALGSDEELGIWTVDGVLSDGVDWDEGQSDKGMSYARVPIFISEFQTVSNPTPGAANQPDN